VVIEVQWVQFMDRSAVSQTKSPTLDLRKELADELIGACVDALPSKAYGLVGGKDVYHPQSIYPCSTNIRNAPEWKPLFESFGDFYQDPDRGFVVTPEEQRAVLNRIEARGQSFVGVYHSHRFTDPDPTELDLALHIDSRMLCYIVSVVRAESPQLKVYRLEESSYEEVPYRLL
jgi:proteasome lid subunit RPN8/RPN11